MVGWLARWVRVSPAFDFQKLAFLWFIFGLAVCRNFNYFESLHTKILFHRDGFIQCKTNCRFPNFYEVSTPPFMTALVIMKIKPQICRAISVLNHLIIIYLTKELLFWHNLKLILTKIKNNHKNTLLNITPQRKNM